MNPKITTRGWLVIILCGSLLCWSSRTSSSVNVFVGAFFAPSLPVVTSSPRRPHPTTTGTNRRPITSLTCQQQHPLWWALRHATSSSSSSSSQLSSTRRRRILHSLHATKKTTTKKTKITTEYTIDESVGGSGCGPTRPHILKGIVEKSCQSFDNYHKVKPIAKHTQQAFDQVLNEIQGILKEKQQPDSTVNNNNTIDDHGMQQQVVNVVLDSGCGTGKSTRILGEIYPNHIVIGVDRSYTRLSKTTTTTTTKSNTTSPSASTTSKDDEDEEDSSSSNASKRPICERVSNTNVILVRAELVDFWRLCYNHKKDTIILNIDYHDILYPNPYPTHTRITQRWYGHSIFPLLLKFQSKSIVVRSNWLLYLQEFVQAIQIANDYYENNDDTDDNVVINFAKPYLKSAVDENGPQERQVDDTTVVAWTNFEQKYDTVGETTYELKLDYHRDDGDE